MLLGANMHAHVDHGSDQEGALCVGKQETNAPEEGVGRVGGGGNNKNTSDNVLVPWGRHLSPCGP